MGGYGLLSNCLERQDAELIRLGHLGKDGLLLWTSGLSLWQMELEMPPNNFVTLTHFTLLNCGAEEDS